MNKADCNTLLSFIFYSRTQSHDGDPHEITTPLTHSFFTAIILVGCESKESSQLQEVTYEPASQASPTEKAEVIGDTLQIAEPKPATDSEGQELLDVRSQSLLYSDAGLVVTLQGKVTIADGVQISKTLWRQVSKSGRHSCRVGR